METCQNITNYERLTSVFGYWPSFHDAEVVWFHLDRRPNPFGAGPTVESLIHVFEMTNEVDARGFYVLRNHVLVCLRFSNVKQLILDDFNHQNALMELGIRDIKERQLERLNFEVTFDSSFGLEASFQCEDVEVVSVEPCNSDGEPAPPVA